MHGTEMLEDMRLRLRAVCGENAFLRFSRQRSALFAADARASASQAAFASAGFEARAEGGALLIRPGAELYGFYEARACTDVIRETAAGDAALMALWFLARTIRRYASACPPDPEFCLCLFRLLLEGQDIRYTEKTLAGAYADALREGRCCRTRLTACLAADILRAYQ